MLIYTSLLLTLVHLVSVYNVLSHSVKLLTPFVHTLVFSSYQNSVPQGIRVNDAVSNV